MSFIPIVKYGLGLGVLGLIYYIMNGIMVAFIDVGEHRTGAAFDLLHAFWTAIIIVYLVFGGWWTIRTYNEEEYMRRGL